MFFPTRYSFCRLRGVSIGRRRRRGISLWLFVATLPIIVGICGLVIDMGQLYSRRAQAQRAADAAALAGAYVSGDNSASTNALVVSQATHYAAINGFDPASTRRPATVRVVPNYMTPGGTGFNNSVYVSVALDEPVYFAPILETLLAAMGKSSDAARFSRRVSASARAEKIVHLPMSLGGRYGIADPNLSPVTLSVFGPEAYYNYGDPYSTQFLQNGTPNPRYDQTGGTSVYLLNVSASAISATKDGLVRVQIFDPDCYVSGNAFSYDEIRPPNPLNQHDATHPDLHTQDATTTQYEIWKDGQRIASTTYGVDATTDGKWIEPNGFAINTSVYGAGEYQIRVKSVDGSSENGFLLRAGPTEGLALNDTDWNNQYGDKMGTAPNNIAFPIHASGHLEMNFIQSGHVTFALGSVPQSQAGKTIGISKFDVDIGSTDLVYTCDTLPGQTFPGTLPQPGDGVWSTDMIQLPANYQGGNWSATYTAGAGDTSNWLLLTQSAGDGDVQLVE